MSDDINNTGLSQELAVASQRGGGRTKEPKSRGIPMLFEI